MVNLNQENCVPCRRGSPALSQAQIMELIQQVEGWEWIHEDNISKLRKTYKFKNFAQAIGFTNQVAQAAEQQDHHPAILTEWGKVTLTWWTHAVQGLHRNDFIMAARSDTLYKEVR